METLQEKLKMGKPLMWSEKKGNHLFVYHNGKLVYKQWLNKKGKKTEPSLLWNVNGLPHEKIY